MKHEAASHCFFLVGNKWNEMMVDLDEMGWEGVHAGCVFQLGRSCVWLVRWYTYWASGETGVMCHRRQCRQPMTGETSEPVYMAGMTQEVMVAAMDSRS
jgi:hypothetical protein